jgi:hypothetical protein
VLFLYGVSSSTSSVSSSARVYSNAWSSEAEGDEARAYPQRLTGVDDARLAMYSAVAGGAWLQCNHNSTRVPPTRVNDGYCDCLVDGLDEVCLYFHLEQKALFLHSPFIDTCEFGSTSVVHHEHIISSVKWT